MNVVTINYLVAMAILCCHFSHAKVILKRIGVPPISSEKRSVGIVDWGTIIQKVDHFNPDDTRVWNMRYLNNSQFFLPGGPLFIFIGGEWEISENFLTSGLMFDMAREHNGYMLNTEHRYYGKSNPMSDYSSESLKYLTAEQALADLAWFITHKKQTVPEFMNSKVVVVGGSYSGTLATWARLKYPSLIDAAHSSSAPLRIVEDFYEYQEVVSLNIYLYNEYCYKTISEAFKLIEKKMRTESDIRELKYLFNTCKPVQAHEPYRSYFFSAIIGIFDNIIQYADPGEINDHCTDILKNPGDPLQKLAAFIRDQYQNNCVGDYDELIEFYKKAEITGNAGRSWLYQTCTEFGFAATTDSRNQIFGHNVPVKLHHSMCSDVFGKKYTPKLLSHAVARINKSYGSTNPNVTKVISVHGSVDPWHRLGIIHDISPLLPASFVQGTSHCADLTSISQSDLEPMVKAKLRVKKLIAEWIQ